MELPYPYRLPNRPVEMTSIYFETENAPTYLTLQSELNQSICLWGPNLHLDGNIVGVQLQLISMYGGDFHHYPVSMWESNIYILKLPSSLNRSLVINDLMPWCLACNIFLTPWDPIPYYSRQPTFAYWLDIIVTGFPILLWHEFYRIRFLSMLGEILHVNDLNLSGHDKSCIMATIRSFNPRAVPRAVIVHFAMFWKLCRIHIREWDDLSYIPPRIRPFPDFSSSYFPYGDNFTEEDIISPIRAHAVCCHDSLREACTPNAGPFGTANVQTDNLHGESQVNVPEEGSVHSTAEPLMVVETSQTHHSPPIDRNTPPRVANPNSHLHAPECACPKPRVITPTPQIKEKDFLSDTGPSSFLSPPTKYLDSMHALHVETLFEQANNTLEHSICLKSKTLDSGLSYLDIPFAAYPPPNPNDLSAHSPNSEETSKAQDPLPDTVLKRVPSQTKQHASKKDKKAQKIQLYPLQLEYSKSHLSC